MCPISDTLGVFIFEYPKGGPVHPQNPNVHIKDSDVQITTPLLPSHCHYFVKKKP